MNRQNSGKRKPNYNSGNLGSLIGKASEKIGTSPETLKQQIDAGRVDDIIRKLPPKQAENFKNILNNPEMAKKLMETPQAKMLMKQFFNQK
jgi:hypothetical protein